MKKGASYVSPANHRNADACSFFTISIINTTSVVAFRGTPEMIDYAATKGAIVSFTRALAKNLIPKGIRVNAVA